jgi:flagellar motility protein MotE (MotC chaperone)
VIAAALLLLGLKAVEFGFASRRTHEVVAVDPKTGREVDMIATGSSGGGHGEEKPKEGEHGAPAEAGQGGGVTPSKVDTRISGDKPTEAKPVPGQELLSEIDVLQKLAARRKQLDEMERQLQMREDLLRASEGRIAKRIEELKGLEEQVGKKAGELEAETAKSQEIDDLVKMYEAMKAKDAARVFDKLDISLLASIARQMNPKKLGDVVAKMAPEQAERLTVELANRKPKPVAQPASATPRELPKIEGRS